MKLIISGLPCCGKTHFGDWLRDEHGFTHANLEPRLDNGLCVIPPTILDDLPRWIGSLGEKIVVTWGFLPSRSSFEIMQRFEAIGFVPWWFDADAAVARWRFIGRDGIERATTHFDPQIASITKARERIGNFYGERRIKTLSQSGYAPLNEIYDAIARPALVPQVAMA